jgi:hypothetical protein
MWQFFFAYVRGPLPVPVQPQQPAAGNKVFFAQCTAQFASLLWYGYRIGLQHKKTTRWVAFVLIS